MKFPKLTDILKAKDSSQITLDEIREQVRSLAMSDERFNKKPEGDTNNCFPCQPYCDNVIFENGDFSAVIYACDGKLWEIEIEIEDGIVTELVGDAREVKPKKTYVAASEPFRFNGKTVMSAASEIVKASGEEKKDEDHSDSGSVAFCKDSGAPIPEAKKWKFGEETDFMWAPGGKSVVTCGCAGRSLRLHVIADKKSASDVQGDFATAVARTPRRLPFGCVEHEEKAKAIEPKKFLWKDDPEPGVYCVGIPTKLGETNVNGRLQTSFSPCFKHDARIATSVCDDCKLSFVKCSEAGNCDGILSFPEGIRGSASNPTHIVGVFEKSIGSLTNWPAFIEMRPVAASQPDDIATAGAPAGNKNAQKKSWDAHKTELGTHAGGAYVDRISAAAFRNEPDKSKAHAKSATEHAESASKIVSEVGDGDKKIGHAFAANTHREAAMANEHSGNYQAVSHHNTQAEMHSRYSTAAGDSSHPDHERAKKFTASEPTKGIFSGVKIISKFTKPIKSIYDGVVVNGQPAGRK